MVAKIAEMVSELNTTVERAIESILFLLASEQSAKTNLHTSEQNAKTKIDPDVENERRTIQRNYEDEQLTERYLSPEERIIRYLSERSEGRCWQATIMDEMEWPPSKTSRVLSSMEECERIRRYRVGKQKCVFLPGLEPDVLEKAV